MWKFPVSSWRCHLYIIEEFRDAIISAPIMTVYPLLNSIRILCCALQVDCTWQKIHPGPNHGFFGFASMPKRNVENEQSDMALLKSWWLSVWLTIFSAFQQPSTFIDDSGSTSMSPCFDFITSKNLGWQVGQRQEGSAEGGVYTMI